MEVKGRSTYTFEEGEISISIKEGEKKNISPHFAKILEKHSIVTIPILTSAILRKKIMEERAHPLPTKLQEDFYETAEFTFEKLAGLNNDEANKVRILVKDLLRLRMGKIHKIVLQTKEPKISLEPVERLFYRKIKTLIAETETEALDGGNKKW